MKIVILGDTHFGGGYSLGRIDTNKRLNSRLIDYSNTFDYVIDFMISNGVSNFIITGDIFENRRPAASELSLFSKKMRKLIELNINTHIVIGNHDTIRDQKTTTLDVLRSLKLSKVNVYPNIKTILCKDENDGINFTFLPFRSRQMLELSSNDEAVNRIKEQLKYELTKIDNNFPKIAVGHFMMQQTQIGETVLDNSPDEIVLPHKIFNKYDGVIMGHVHTHQIIRKKPFISYVGSMECKDFNEAKSNKYFTFIKSCDNKVSFNFELLPVRSLYDITIDESNSDKDIIKNIEKYLIKFSKINNLDDSIVRINIIMNNITSYNFNKDKIRQFLKENFKIHNCIGIFQQVISKRQLRNSSITENNDPIESFREYLKTIPNSSIRDKMWEIGISIINNRGQYVTS